MRVTTPSLTVPVGEHDHMRGPNTAPVTLVEYGDFECPYCGAAHPIVQHVEREMRDELRFVFRHCPLTEIHPNAGAAALAAEAAGVQGKFWEMHDALFEHQDLINAGNFAPIVNQVGLDRERFEQDIVEQSLAKRIQQDFLSGVRSGVNGTPTFFINDVRYDGRWDYPQLLGALRDALHTTQGR